MIHTLKMFNTGQITLPKIWREKFKTHNFVAQETNEGLLIKPLGSDENVIFYEDSEGFGIYSPTGIDPDKIMQAIKDLNAEDTKLKRKNVNESCN